MWIGATLSADSQGGLRTLAERLRRRKGGKDARALEGGPQGLVGNMGVNFCRRDTRMPQHPLNKTNVYAGLD